MEYVPLEKPVEVDLGVLDEIDNKRRIDPSTHSTAPVAAPVLRMPLPTYSEGIVEPLNNPQSLTAAPEQDATPVVRRLLKPTAPRTTVEDTPELTLQPVEKPVRMPEPEYLPVITEDPLPETLQDSAPEDSLSAEEALVPPPSLPSLEPPAATPPLSPEPPAVPSFADLSLDFTGNSSDLTPDARQRLDNIVAQMQEAVDNRLQVRAYASGEDGTKSSARRISLSRALAVRSYLMDKGIKPTRVDVRAMGTETDRSPLDRVDLVFAR